MHVMHMSEHNPPKRTGFYAESLKQVGPKQDSS